LQEKKTGWRQWALILIFCVDVHMELNPIPPVHMRPPVPDPLPPPCGRHTWMAPYLYLSRPPISFSEVLQPLFSLCCTSSLERTPKFKTYQFAHPPNPPLIFTPPPLALSSATFTRPSSSAIATTAPRNYVTAAWPSRILTRNRNETRSLDKFRTWFHARWISWFPWRGFYGRWEVFEDTLHYTIYNKL